VKEARDQSQIFNTKLISRNTAHRKSYHLIPFVTNLSAVEIKLTEMQENLLQKKFCQCHSGAIIDTDTLTFNAFTTGMLSMVLTLGNGQIWLGVPPVVSQFILVFFHVMVCSCLFAKNIRSHSVVGKRTECVWKYVSLKNFSFLLGT